MDFIRSTSVALMHNRNSHLDLSVHTCFRLDRNLPDDSLHFGDLDTQPTEI